MKALNNNKKGAELPLNVIVIAIIVILVLLIVILFFTSRMGQTGDNLDGTTEGFTDCKVGSYAIPEKDYTSPTGYSKNCGNNQVRIYSIPKKDGKVCCATPKTETTETETDQ